MERISLNGSWEIIERPLSFGPQAVERIWDAQRDVIGQVPGDISDSLVTSNRLPEPLVGLNFQQFGWVKDRSWWMRKRITTPTTWEAATGVELCLDGLDIHADVWLNQQYLGHHRSAFYPFVAEVGEILSHGGENTLLVRLTTGLDRIGSYPDFPLLEGVPTEAGRGYPERGEKRRIYLRKPAYVWGWDWGPHLPTCGITGDGSCLQARNRAEITDISITTHLGDGVAVVLGTVELDYDTQIDSARGTLSVNLTDEDGQSHSVCLRDVLVRSGCNHYRFLMEIPEPRLWWPQGSGSQHLYTVTATVVVDDVRSEYAPFRYGLRTIELDTSPGRFAFNINGHPLFIKGGNWIPSDSLYGRITADKLTRLVEEAATANLNCLRIWGGGRYERDAFYDACDKEGILVWHDFMSACAPLPAHEDWFHREFCHEAEYQVRRLRNRTCLLLWCGNNEVSQIYNWDVFTDQSDPGWALYHRILPRMLQSLCPHIPYWPTSPYGGQGTVHAPDEGDDHHWVVMRPQPEFWSSPEYWDAPERPIFNSEYGYGGPCSLESTRQYFGDESPDLFSETGRQHTNTFYDIPRVNFSIAEHYGDPQNLELPDYILLGGLCQGLNLGYSLESLRANEHSMGGIFWMYNDTWGENGWTIIDYYLRRKISYYQVKRCLAPVRLVLRRGGAAFGGDDNEVVLVVLNDSDVAVSGRLKLGYLRYDGQQSQLQDIDLHIAPRSKGLVASCPLPDETQLRRGTVVAVPPSGSSIEPVSWRHCRFRDAEIGDAHVSIEHMTVHEDDLIVTVTTDSFAHAVHFPIAADYRLSDHFFDLLPGERRRVRIYQGANLESQAIRVRSVGQRRPTDHA